MSRARIKSTRSLLFSNTTTIGVGSAWTSNAVDVSDYKSFAGICQAASVNMTIAFEQSAVNSPFDVSSTLAIAPGATALSWTGLGQYAQLRITAVNSSAGIMRLHVYGIPI